MNSSYKTEEPLRGTISINFNADEIASDVKKRLSEVKNGMQIPGFRKGKVPTSLIEKKYGDAVRYEIAENKAIEEVQKVLEEQKPSYVAGPLRVDLKNGTDGEYAYEFHFALAPQMEVPIDKNIKIAYYTVKASEKDLEQEDEAYRMSTRKIADVDTFEGNDHLEGLLEELDEKGEPMENGIKVENAFLLPSYFRTDEDKKQFEGSKKGDVIVFNPYNAHAGNASVVAGLFSINKEEVEKHKGNFRFTVNTIKRHVPEELGEEFYKKIFGEETGVKDEESYRNELKKRIEARYEAQAKALFRSQLIKLLTEKAGQPTLDEQTIKAVLNARHAEADKEHKPFTAEELEKQYDLFARYTYYDQMTSQIMKKIGAEVTRSEIEQVVREQIVQDMLRYGYGIDGMETLIDQLVKQRVEDPEQIYQAESILREQAIADYAYNEVKINAIETTADEFNKILDDHYNAKNESKSAPLNDQEKEHEKVAGEDSEEAPKKKSTKKSTTKEENSEDKATKKPSAKKSTTAKATKKTKNEE